MLGFFDNNHKAKLRALDTISANIMIADAKLNITYLNDATRELLKQAEDDLKKELPRFQVDKLVGSNIDIFHKNPSHQRGMLSKLTTQHRATISVGPHSFDLIVTPLKHGQAVTGFVVEWADARARLQNLDYQAQMEAISRVQAVIAFTPDGEVLSANQNFLEALDYRLDEIKGQHHRMFVDPDYAASQKYQDFWSQLRAGKVQAAEFVRLGKRGKRVVINASYNPVLDEKGRVAKVVKFATVVTERVHAVDTIGDALTRMAAGDLSFEVTNPFAPDFELLRSNLNAALAQLNGTLSGVSQSSDLLESNSREISDSANDLSRRTEQQAASLEETAAALDEITVNVTNASRRAEEARSATQTADESAARSGRIVAEAVEAMAGIERSSSQVSNIIAVIDEIAFQTNLLALNAGVEAARAGEAGKGFAVVAQEVRELAQRSAQAAKEIKELIRSSSEEVAKGVKLVSETGAALKIIQQQIVSINDHMQAIASSAKEQATGLAEVNTAVNQMDQTTQQNAAMVEESTAASATLAKETAKLREMVAQFQLRDTSRLPVPAAAAPTTSWREDAAPERQARIRRRANVGNAALQPQGWEDF